MRFTKPFAMLLLFALSGCAAHSGSPAGTNDRTDDTNSDDSAASGPVVSLQVVHGGDATVLDSILASLRARGIPATILVTAGVIADQCPDIQAAQADGFEIGVFVGPEASEGGGETLPSLTRPEQETRIAALKDAAEECLGSEVTLFGCAEYSQNSDTYDVVDALGFEYNLGFVSNTEHQLPGHANDIFPYSGDEYGFWAVPMHSLFFDGQWLPLEDDVFAALLGSSEWGALLTQELDRLREQNRPFRTRVHTDMTGGDAGRLDAFVALLDLAVQRRSRFMTVSQYVAWAETRPTDPDCEAP